MCIRDSDLPAACRRARECGLSADVEPLGEQELVVPLLSISDLCLLPSSQESFGVAALEAMACEVPVVASRVGGLPEVVTHNRTGFLHDPGDLAGMAQSAINLLTDKDLHQRIATSGWREVHDRFCADEIVPKYEAYYEEVMATRSRERHSAGVGTRI